MSWNDTDVSYLCVGKFIWMLYLCGRRCVWMKSALCLTDSVTKISEISHLAGRRLCWAVSCSPHQHSHCRNLYRPHSALKGKPKFIQQTTSTWVLYTSRCKHLHYNNPTVCLCHERETRYTGHSRAKRHCEAMMTQSAILRHCRRPLITIDTTADSDTKHCWLPWLIAYWACKARTLYLGVSLTEK